MSTLASQRAPELSLELLGGDAGLAVASIALGGLARRLPDRFAHAVELVFELCVIASGRARAPAARLPGARRVTVSGPVVCASPGRLLADDLANAPRDLGQALVVVVRHPDDLVDQLHELARVAGPERLLGERDRRAIGLPAPFIGLMRVLPAWKKLTGIAHTLPYDLSIVNAHQQGEPLPEGRYAGVEQETLVIAGSKGPKHMRNAQAGIAAAVPNARLETLPGQTHMVKPKATCPVIIPFFQS